MKNLLKKVALCAFALSFIGLNTIQAQAPFSVVMVEEFDAPGVIPAGWTATVNTPPFTDPPSGVQDGWEVLNTAGVTASYGGNTIYWTLPPDNGGNFAVANDDQCNCDASNDMLTSPVYDMSPYDSLWIFFDVFLTGEFGSIANLDFTVNGGAVWNTISLPTDPADWQGLYVPLQGPFGDVQFSFVHSDESMAGDDNWAAGAAIDSLLLVGFNQPCDDVLPIASCGAPQTVTLSGAGVIDFDFIGPCGFELPGNEQFYSFTPTVSGMHTVNVSSATGTSYIDYMYKPAAAASCDTLGWTCIGDIAFTGEFGGANLVAGVEYIFLLDNESTISETQTFTIECPCTFVPGNSSFESEACGADLNGGCNETPEVYESISCGQSLTGTCWAENGDRDLDWYELVVTETTNITVDFGGALPLNGVLFDNNCTTLNQLSAEVAGACETGNITFSATPGTYHLLIGATGFHGYPCNSGLNQYNLTVDYCETTGPIDPCLTFTTTYNNLNTEGGAPCDDGNGCTPTDANFQGFGIWGGDSYILDNVQAGADYVFNMCTGFNAGTWIPEITIIAPDGTTVDAWNGEAATGSSLTFFDQCSLGWTASQSGTYRINVHQLGTAAGDAPDQVDCTTGFLTDNGSPIVLCGPNEATCLPCEAGAYTNDFNQEVCPGETALISLDGNQSSPSDYSIGFSNALGGTSGGLNGGDSFTITGFDLGLFPLDLDADINGTLSGEGAPEMTGAWVLTFYATDGLGENCDSTLSMVVNFLDANNPACLTVGVEEEQAATTVKVYPNPSNGNVTLELEGYQGLVNLTVTDVIGKQVYAEQLNVSANYRKNLSLNVPKGTYLVHVGSDDAKSVQKIEIH
ncbi:MAG: T9SS type A sorting domain-containing protein [Flavobacteriales bacterium]